MLRLEKTGARIVPSCPVLKRTEYAAVVEGAAIVAAAREEAERIVAEAREAFEARREEGHREGLEAGKEEIAEHLLACMSQSAAYFSKVESVLVDVVIRALRRVLGDFDDREVVEKVIRRALETTRNEGHVTVRVSPAQADWLHARVQDLADAFPDIEFLEVLPDERLPADGCILETEIGVVDATLETQLRAIEKALVNAME